MDRLDGADRSSQRQLSVLLSLDYVIRARSRSAQHAVLDYMGEVAAQTRIPPSVFDVFGPLVLVGLALAGLAMGVVGAFGPASRAARGRIAPVLQAE